MDTGSRAVVGVDGVDDAGVSVERMPELGVDGAVCDGVTEGCS